VVQPLRSGRTPDLGRARSVPHTRGRRSSHSRARMHQTLDAIAG